MSVHFWDPHKKKFFSFNSWIDVPITMHDDCSVYDDRSHIKQPYGVWPRDGWETRTREDMHPEFLVHLLLLGIA